MINRRSIRKMKEKINGQIQDTLMKDSDNYVLNKDFIQNYLVILVFLSKSELFTHFSKSQQSKLKKTLFNIFKKEFSPSITNFQEIQKFVSVLPPNMTFFRDNQLSSDQLKWNNNKNEVSMYSNIFLGQNSKLADIFEFHAILQTLRYDSTNKKSQIQKNRGAFFTPLNVINFILESLNQKLLDSFKTRKKVRILDYSCGMGGFIICTLVYISNLLSDSTILHGDIEIEFWGIDIDIFALDIAQFSLKLLNNNDNFNASQISVSFFHQDSLKPIDDKNIISNDLNLKFRHQLCPFNEKFSDFILSNPPYVSWGLGRVGKLGKDQTQMLRQNFSHSAEYKISYYAIFIERAIQLLKNHGFAALVVPDSFLMGKYFHKLRNYILHTTRIQEINLFQRNFWSGVDSGLPVIIIFQKDAMKIKKQQMISRMLSFSPQHIKILHEYQMDQQYFAKISRSRFRLLFSEESLLYINRLEQNSIPLDQLFEIHHGIRSKKGIGKKEITSKLRLGSSWMPGLVSGNDVEPYKLSYRGFYINTKPENLYSGGYQRYHIEQNKIILRRTSDRLIAAVDEKGYYHTNTLLYIIPKEGVKSPISLYELCALLNSNLLNKYYALISLKSKRTLPQVEIDMLNKIPLKIQKESAEIIQLVKKIHTLKTKNTRTNEEEQEITNFFDLIEKNLENLYLKLRI
ncbi:TaqI-like C-terminal specificity domain-containing protein [Candidatus Lokiarchaeum ossiferum]